MWSNLSPPWTRGEVDTTPHKLDNSPFYFLDLFLCLSFSSAIGKEAGRWLEIMQENVGCAGATARFIATWYSNQGGKAARLWRHGKKGTVKMSLCIMQLLVRQAFYIMGYDNRI
jgi:hypothetical protein